MNRLELFYPAKPFYQTQAWGIYNPAYSQFAFDLHNGVDFLPATDSKLYMPVKAKLVEKDYIPNGSGNFVRFKTTEKWNIEGVDCYLGFVMMHLKYLPDYPVGTVLDLGDLVGTANNTGFSTGPHTHFAPYRLGDNDERLDTSPTALRANQTFNPEPYWNGRYAVSMNNALNKALRDALVALAGLYQQLIGKK